jgi:hypothetical protein
MRNNKKSILTVLSFLIFLVLTSSLIVAEKDKPITDHGNLKVEHIFGEIQFNEKVESYDSKEKLNSKTEFKQNYIKVEHKDLKNKKAKLTFKMSDVQTPILLRDGVWVKNAKIKKKDLTSWEVDVDHFSIYEIVEQTFIGTFDNTTITNSNLTLTGDAVFIATFEENESTVYDKSLYGNDIDTSAPTKHHECKFGTECLIFDGVNDHVNLRDFDYSSQNQLVVSAFVNKSDTDTDIIFSNHQGGSYDFQLSTVSNKARFYIRDSTGAYIGVDSTNTYSANEKFHIAGMYNGTDIAVYLNGVETLSAGGIGGLFGIADGRDTLIGMGVDGSGDPQSPVDGVIECVQFFTGSMVQSEILGINSSSTCDEAYGTPTITYPDYTLKLDEYKKNQRDSSVYKDSGLGNNPGIWASNSMTPTQITNISQECRYGNFCLEFDGVNDFVNFTDVNDYEFNQAVSYAFNFRTTDSGTQVISSKSKNSPGYNGTQIYMGISELYFRMYEGGLTTGIKVRTNTGGSLADGVLHNAVITYNGNMTEEGVTIYIDGISQSLVKSANSGFTNTILNDADFVIGKSSYGSLPFTGNVDCFAIVAGELASEQVLAINSSPTCIIGGVSLYTPVTVKTHTGTVNSGNVDSLINLDGDYYNVSEVGGAPPGFNISMNITAPPIYCNLLSIDSNYWYDGNPGHIVEMQLYNYSSDTYFTIGTFPQAPGFGPGIFPIDPSWFISGGDGLIRTRITHTSPGSNMHLFALDQFGITVDCSATSVYELEPKAGDLDAFYNDDNATLGFGSFEFDGTHDFINLENPTEIEFVSNQSHSLSLWFKSNNNHLSTIGSLFYDLSGTLGEWIYISDSGNLVYRFGAYSCVESGIEDDKWYHLTTNYESSTNTMGIYLNGSLVESCNPPNGYKNSVASGDAYIGRQSIATNYAYNGLIDEFKIFNRSLNTSEISNLYTSSPLSKYDISGKFTNITNGTNYESESQANLWKTLTLNSSDCSQVDRVEARGFDCVTPTGPYGEAIKSGCSFALPLGLTGQCLDWFVVLESDSETSPQISGYNISVNMTFKPSINLTNIWGGDNTTVNITANATFVVNNTDSGSVLFEWYINGNLNALGYVEGVVNGDVATATLHNTFFNKDDDVWVDVLPIIDSVQGARNSSNNITVGNANFQVTWKPNQNTTTAKPGSGRTFTATLVDIDNDANISWYIDGVFAATGNSWKYLPAISDVDSIFTITGNASDGEFSYINEWEVTIEEVNMGLAMVAVMLFLGVLMIVFGLATWYFDNGLKFFFLLLTSLTMLVGLNISATVAASVSEPIGNVLWTVYRVGLVVFMFLFFVVLVKFTGELKLRRNAINTDNLDSPGQNKALIGGRGK